jgi:hypothetical protein
MNKQKQADEVPDDLVEVARGAGLARCSPSQLYRWIGEGRLAGWRRCGRTFVSAGEVRRLFRPIAPRRPRTQRTHQPGDAGLRERDRHTDEVLRRHGLA